MKVMVLNDNETYTAIKGCTIVEFDENISPDDIDHFLDIILKNGDYCTNARILGRFAADGKYLVGDPRDKLNEKITK